MLDESLLDADFLVQATDGLTCAFEDDDGQEFNPNFFNENDTNEQRSSYLEQFTDVSVTKWKHEKDAATRIELNGAEETLFLGMKASIEPTLAVCQRLLGKSLVEITPSHFLGVFLNRDWYLMIQDYINFRVEDPKDRPTINEIHEMQRIWVLQCIYEVTAKKLFSNKD
jgi:hypothetical protein